MSEGCIENNIYLDCMTCPHEHRCLPPAVCVSETDPDVEWFFGEEV